jgi:hypothetical protein
MKFYGRGSVWDTRKNKRLCKFEGTTLKKDGVYETTDVTEIGYLIKAGIKHEDVDYGDKVKPAKKAEPKKVVKVGPKKAVKKAGK